MQTAKLVQTTNHLRKWSHQIIKKIAPLISRHPYFFHSENVPWCPIICVSVLDRSNFWIMRIEDSSATYIMLKLWTCPTIGHRVRPSPSEKNVPLYFPKFLKLLFSFFFKFQTNRMTSWIDASFVYSTREAWVNSMRSFQNGSFKMEGDPILGLPPKNIQRVPLANHPAPHFLRMLNPERMYCKYF